SNGGGKGIKSPCHRRPDYRCRRNVGSDGISFCRISRNAKLDLVMLVTLGWVTSGEVAPQKEAGGLNRRGIGRL
ncbi:MAG: hypothetical protein ACXWVI_04810, partial [Methyloceanibacter sp.]